MADNTGESTGPEVDRPQDLAAVADTGARAPSGNTGKFLQAVAFDLLGHLRGSPKPLAGPLE